ADRLTEESIQAVAICFINANINAAHEEAATRYLQERLPELSISISTQLLPQIQEFERTSTTVINAYLRPVVERYVTMLSQRIQDIGIKVPLMIMQSSGGVLPGPLAGANPVYIIESGPAAGVVGSQRLAQHLGLGNLIVLDMGGTTAKASIIHGGEFTIMPGAEVGEAQAGSRLIQGAGYPIQVPTIDIAEVGAGGGIQVGPRSAGANPGPVCYDHGGTEPTVTDANVILGYLNSGALVGGDLKMNFEKAEQAIGDLGEKLGQDLTDMAYGIHLIANATMMRAMRGVTSERGRDPSQFSLITMGGNGGVHAAGLADALEIARILVPPAAGLFSAMGLSFAHVEHHLVRTFYHRLDETDPEAINAVARSLIDEAESLLVAEGFAEPAQRRLDLLADVKYVGQAWTLAVPLADFPVTDATLEATAEVFAQAHKQNYGYRSDEEPLQTVALKLVGRGLSDLPRLPDRVSRVGERVAEKSRRKAYFGPDHGWVETTVLPRASLTRMPVDGPLIVEEYDTTTVVRPGWNARLDGWNNIVLERV
ncbi:MAG: hydantoinase/oxoprolinase family protein, partial [Alphaproteobacteria bacterium]|nr:hydantoinase/oxoprolinase family protein [Alphaproteobacteria bacterium]